MSDYKQMKISDMESIWSGGLVRARASLGVTAFGLGVGNLPPDFDHTPKHVHTFDNQEEVFFTLGGSGWLEVNDERIECTPSKVVRVGPSAARRSIAGPEGISQLVIGGIIGEPYKPFPVSELGEPAPKVMDLPGVQAAHAHESTDDYTAIDLDEMDSIAGHFPGVTMYPVRRALGVTSVGVNVIDLQPHDDADEGSGHPRHDHESTGQEEVYVPIAGSGEVEIDGERVAVKPGEMIRIAPNARRKLFPSAEGLRVIAIGGTPGKAYEPPNLSVTL